MSKKPTAAPTLKGYINSKGIFNYGIPTAVICLIIYFFLKGDSVKFISIGNDLWISVFVTVFICSITGIPGILGDIRKEKAPAAELTAAAHPVYRHFSGNMVLMSLQFSLAAMLIFAMIPGGIFATIAVMSGNLDLAINPYVYWVLKSLYSGFFVACTLRWVTACTLCHRAAK